MLLSQSTQKKINSIKEQKNFKEANPFPHIIIDNFFEEKFADKLSRSFPDYESTFLDNYSNAIEEKKLVNHWNKFTPTCYEALHLLCSDSFVKKINKFVPESKNLRADYGLHGGGIHMHKKGGKLNIHLDYSIHPKLNLQRKLNILIYLTKNWQEKWGGVLGLYSNESSEKPGNLIKQIIPIFNRAIIFDVTANSWHGLPHEIKCPNGITRNSLAVYYLQEIDSKADPNRLKARFYASPWQKNDKTIQELINKRSNLNTSSNVYQK